MKIFFCEITNSQIAIVLRPYIRIFFPYVSWGTPLNPFFYTSWKSHPQKLLRIPQIHFFSPTASTAQMAQTEEIMFQNVAYWLTVYRTGVRLYGTVYHLTGHENDINLRIQSSVYVYPKMVCLYALLHTIVCWQWMLLLSFIVRIIKGLS